MNKQFVPADFPAPLRVETPDFIVRKLTTADAERDYAAVMSSTASLRKIFSADDEWPSDEMTLEENRADLQRHEDHFEDRRGFTYTVVDTADEICLGCIYIYYSRVPQYDAEVNYWVTDEAKAAGLEEKLSQFMDDWLANTWPVERPALPGRKIPWDVWEALMN